MKAREYYDKYNTRFFNGTTRLTLENATDAVWDLFLDFLNEIKDLSKIRHCKSNASLEAIFRELNQKWNALVVLFIARNGVSPIKKDGFNELYKRAVSITQERKHDHGLGSEKKSERSTCQGGETSPEETEDGQTSNGADATDGNDR